MPNIPFSTEEAMKSGVYISGTTGTGKSDIAMYQAEQLMREGIIVIVFDPSQDWITRSSIRGFGMPKMDEYLWNGHVPQRNFIFDLSQLCIVENEGFVEDFCKALMRQQARETTNRLRYFLIFEEAHTYFPQGCMTARAYRNTVRMMTQGRNYGVRFACITQFAAMIDKNAMRYMTQRYFGTTDEPNDVAYIGRFFPKKKNTSDMFYFREHIETLLPTLKSGEFIFKGRAWQTTFEITPFASESTPTITEPPPAPPIAPMPQQNAGSGAVAMAKLLFLTMFAILFLWIISSR
jgi:hypothetical protein